MSNFKVGDKVRWCEYIGVIGDVDYDDDTAWVEFAGVNRSGGWYSFRTLTLLRSDQKLPDSPKYVIVQGKAQDVVAEVEQCLKQGYKLQGGVSMYQDWFAQALVLNEPC